MLSIDSTHSCQKPWGTSWFSLRLFPYRAFSIMGRSMEVSPQLGPFFDGYLHKKSDSWIGVYGEFLRMTLRIPISNQEPPYDAHLSKGPPF